MSKGFNLQVRCEKCGTMLNLKGQCLPRYKVCSNCKTKNVFHNKEIRFHIFVNKGELELL